MRLDYVASSTTNPDFCRLLGHLRAARGPAKVAAALVAIANQSRDESRARSLKSEAKAILGSTHYGDNGYFFVYDEHGICLVHPTMPELVGRDLRTIVDPQVGG